MNKMTLLSSSYLILTFATCAQAGTVMVETGKGKGPAIPAIAPTPANPLSFAGGKVVFDFQEKVRFEMRENNFDFNSGVDALTDDSWLLQRARLGLKLKPTEWLTIYAQGQDSREIGSDRPNVVGQLGAEGDDSFDLLEGWVELGNPKEITLKVGRQKFNYGDQRMFGPLEWSNVSRAFDAAKVRIVQPTWSLDAFTGSVVPFVDNKFNESDILSGAARDQLFSGLYFSSTALPLQKTDVYLLNLQEDTATGKTNFYTIGTLWKGNAAKLNGWDYTLESMYQFGDVKGKDLSSFATHVDAGYTFAKQSWKPRVGLEYNYGSGDSNPADGKVNTFQNLFPTNHLFYGSMDLFSLQNIHNVGLSVKAMPTAKLKLTADYQTFWLADTSDNWYRANGTASVRTAQPKGSNFAGTELDLTADYKFNPHLALQVGYSHFFAGKWLESSGPSDDADFVWLQASIDF